MRIREGTFPTKYSLISLKGSFASRISRGRPSATCSSIAATTSRSICHVVVGAATREVGKLEQNKHDQPILVGRNKLLGQQFGMAFGIIAGAGPSLTRFCCENVHHRRRKSLIRSNGAMRFQSLQKQSTRESKTTTKAMLSIRRTPPAGDCGEATHQRMTRRSFGADPRQSKQDKNTGRGCDSGAITQFYLRLVYDKDGTAFPQRRLRSFGFSNPLLARRSLLPFSGTLRASTSTSTPGPTIAGVVSNVPFRYSKNQFCSTPPGRHSDTKEFLRRLRCGVSNRVPARRLRATGGRRRM